MTTTNCLKCNSTTPIGDRCSLCFLKDLFFYQITFLPMWIIPFLTALIFSNKVPEPVQIVFYGGLIMSVINAAMYNLYKGKIKTKINV